MLKDTDREQLKKEIKSEILAELKGGNFDFDAYKQQATDNDIDKLELHLSAKSPWYYYLPLIGFIAWMRSVNILLASLDRGTLRKNIVIKSMSFWPIMLYWLPSCFGITMFLNYGPAMNRYYGKEVIKKTREEFDK